MVLSNTFWSCGFSLMLGAFGVGDDVSSPSCLMVLSNVPLSTLSSSIVNTVSFGADFVSATAFMPCEGLSFELLVLLTFFF